MEVTYPQISNVAVWFEPTDIHKARKPFETNLWKTIDFVSPNFNELKLMAKAAGVLTEEVPDADKLTDEEVIARAKDMASALAGHIRTVIATLGHRGVVVCRRDSDSAPFFHRASSAGEPVLLCSEGSPDRLPQARHYPAPARKVVSASGAGDCWNAGFIVAALRGRSEQQCVLSGFLAASRSLQVTSAVPSDLREEDLREALIDTKTEDLRVV